MHSREVVDVLTDDDTEVLEAHPVDALVNGRDELDERDRRSRIGLTHVVSSRARRSFAVLKGHSRTLAQARLFAPD
jgi:hypothetical protein